MINLNPISRVEADDIETILSEKNSTEKKVILLRLKNKILDRYGLHIEIESFNRILNDEFEDDEREALKSLYSSQTITAKKIISEILGALDDNHSGLCLYCGVGEMDQIDHFLPQEHFPEFSILHKNLIPICGKCNEIKGANIPGKNGRDYLHLVYDLLPIENFLECQISYVLNVPSCNYSILPKFDSTKIMDHFDNLKLAKRIEKKAVQYFLQIRSLKDEFGVVFAQDELDRDLVKSRHFFTDFFWKTELIKKMIETDFLNRV